MKTSNIVLGVLSLVVLRYFFGLVMVDEVLTHSTKPFIVPIFSVFVAIRLGKQLSAKYMLFLFFFYAIEMGVLFYDDIYTSLIVLTGMLGSYSTLVIMAIPHLKGTNLTKKILIYLVVILGINFLFLFMMNYIISGQNEPALASTLVLLNTLIGIALAILAGVSFMNMVSKKGLLFFALTFGLIFSDVLVVTTTFFYDYTSLGIVSQVLHYTSLFLSYFYVAQGNKKFFYQLEFLELELKLERG